jgi:hypothetical protein
MRIGLLSRGADRVFYGFSVEFSDKFGRVASALKPAVSSLRLKLWRRKRTLAERRFRGEICQKKTAGRDTFNGFRRLLKVPGVEDGKLTLEEINRPI